MQFESEVKVRISKSELLAIRAGLEGLGITRVSPVQLEVNQLYDLPDGSLHRKGCVLRLRTYGGQCTLTFKGPRQPSETLKVREELEAGISDDNVLHLILERLGFQPVLHYSKLREKYHWAREDQVAEISIDSTTMGHFVELEGSQQLVGAVLSHFGWDSSRLVSESYPELFTRQPD